MKVNHHYKNFFVAMIVTILMAVFGGLLGFQGMSEWYPSLIKPLDIPLWLFSIVQAFYYIICVGIIFRLLTFVTDKASQKFSLSLFTGMMLLAELWNYFFLGLKSVSLGFFSILVFSLIAVLVYFNLKHTDRLSSIILTPYLLWLIIDIFWLFRLWQANS